MNTQTEQIKPETLSERVVLAILTAVLLTTVFASLAIHRLARACGLEEKETSEP